MCTSQDFMFISLKKTDKFGKSDELYILLQW